MICSIIQIMSFCIAITAFGQEHNDASKVSLFTQKVDSGTYVPEFTYAVTTCDKPLILGPLSPCTGVICSLPNSIFIFGAHMHPRNNATALPDLIQKELQIIDTTQPMHIIMYTRTVSDKSHKFKEITHLGRTRALYALLHTKFPRAQFTTYHVTKGNYNLSEEDRWLIATKLSMGGIGVFRYCPFFADTLKGQWRETKYGADLLKQHFGLQAYLYVPNSIWECFDVPLIRVDDDNLAYINQLPKQRCDAYLDLFC